jgi:glutamine amidotransferase-like uncharacterized protein
MKTEFENKQYFYSLSGQGVWDESLNFTNKKLKEIENSEVITINDFSYLPKLDFKGALVVPGGSAFQQCIRSGSEKIAKFVESGNNYLGICAGAFLATKPFLGIVNDAFNDSKEKIENQKLRIRKIYTTSKEETRPVIYFGGPEFCPFNNKKMESKILATFSDNDSPAVISGFKGDGKVLLTSHHWELDHTFEFDKYSKYFSNSLSEEQITNWTKTVKETDDLITKNFLALIKI